MGLPELIRLFYADSFLIFGVSIKFGHNCYIFLWIFYLVYPVGFSILFIDVGIKKN